MKHRDLAKGITQTNQQKNNQSPKKNFNVWLAITIVLVVIVLLGNELFKKGTFKSEDKKETKAEVDTSTQKLEQLDTSFKEKQLKYIRVREAFRAKRDTLKTLLKSKGINSFSIDIYLRVFKQEQELELWVKARESQQYILLKTYKICKLSGKIGPKRKDGDGQIPEGFYHIDRYNASSKYHLSLGLNYPNRADRIRSDSLKTGSDIYIHGDCISVSSIAITDDFIKEVYLLAIEAKSDGQERVPVSIFPTRLTNNNLKRLEEETNETSLKKFWGQLKKGYDYFEKCKQLPNVTINSKGEYLITSECQ
ncbi:MAG: hypothetical protein EAZ55_05595 [Cytophagales bacterium]|nr:MAG: hypothetical protein EAZ55_05595 [Cytophagales bacterium]